MRLSLYVIKRNIGARLNIRGKKLYDVIGALGGSVFILISLVPFILAAYIFSKM
jgi:hypothetical protein